MNIADIEIERLKEVVDDPESLYEDYAYVLSELHDKGIRTVLCEVWCEECEEESEAPVDTGTLRWTCPLCQHVNG